MSLFDLQPASCRQPLSPRPLRLRGRLAPLIRRVIAYDPGPAFERIAHTADPMKRIQTRGNMGLQQLFPKKRDGYCDCGCGAALEGRQTRWAGPGCSAFTWYVYAIIAGRREEIRRCLRAYHGRTCTSCNRMPGPQPKRRGWSRSGLETDHLVPVSQGGGACWLSNYRPLCIDCHRQKTSAGRRRPVNAL